MEGQAVTTPFPRDIPDELKKGVLDEPLAFAEFGLDRANPLWVEIDWAMPVLHLGPGEKHIPDTIEFDWPDWDFDAFDLNRGYSIDYGKRTAEDLPFIGRARLPFRDGECGGVIATHVLEHLHDPRPLLREVSRILSPGAPFNILVPHGESLMFKQDLDHRTPFVIETWKTLLSNPYYTKGKDGFSFRLGANFVYGVKEANLALVTQLIKE